MGLNQVGGFEAGVADDAAQVDHGVDGAVVDEEVLPPERHAADVALVLADRLLRRGHVVTAHVPRQVVAQQERPSAQLARVGSQAGVRGYVPGQLDGGGEAGLAVVALVRLVLVVHGLVPFQALFEDEALVALLALERPLFPVLLHVHVEVVFGQEHPLAFGAVKLGGVVVYFLVAAQLRFTIEGLFTHHAGVGSVVVVRGLVLLQVELVEELFVALVALEVTLPVVVDHVEVQ